MFSLFLCKLLYEHYGEKCISIFVIVISSDSAVEAKPPELGIGQASLGPANQEDPGKVSR